MFFPGLLVVFICVFGGYIMMGGNLAIILKALPMEIMIILGTGIGAFIIGNTKFVLGSTNRGVKRVLSGPRYNKEDYLEILGLMYMIFKLAKSKGMVAIESHVEKPEESELLTQFPKIHNDKKIVEFLCDYLRMMVMGSDNSYQMEDIIEAEIETHHLEDNQVSGAFRNLADALPALGIVAAVLGIIKTMAAIDQPAEILGKMIGAALVGTFLGVFISYGIVGPLASNLASVQEQDTKMFQCIKTGLIAYMNGFAPAVAVEFARKTLMSHQRPDFYAVEEIIQDL